MTDLYEARFLWPSRNASDVIVTGTFDNWSSSLHLTKGEDGFSATVKVPWGQKVLYKFVVDGRWQTTDKEQTERDWRGNLNNVYYPPSKPASLVYEQAPVPTAPAAGGVMPDPAAFRPSSAVTIEAASAAAATASGAATSLAGSLQSSVSSVVKAAQAFAGSLIDQSAVTPMPDTPATEKATNGYMDHGRNAVLNTSKKVGDVIAPIAEDPIAEAQSKIAELPSTEEVKDVVKAKVDQAAEVVKPAVGSVAGSAGLGTSALPSVAEAKEKAVDKVDQASAAVTSAVTEASAKSNGALEKAKAPIVGDQSSTALAEAKDLKGEKSPVPVLAPTTPPAVARSIPMPILPLGEPRTPVAGVEQPATSIPVAELVPGPSPGAAAGIDGEASTHANVISYKSPKEDKLEPAFTSPVETPAPVPAAETSPPAPVNDVPAPAPVLETPAPSLATETPAPVAVTPVPVDETPTPETTGEAATAAVVGGNKLVSPTSEPAPVKADLAATPPAVPTPAVETVSTDVFTAKTPATETPMSAPVQPTLAPAQAKADPPTNLPPPSTSGANGSTLSPPLAPSAPSTPTKKAFQKPSGPDTPGSTKSTSSSRMGSLRRHGSFFSKVKEIFHHDHEHSEKKDKKKERKSRQSLSTSS